MAFKLPGHLGNQKWVCPVL